ncbi:MAG: glycosyltransferase, partial [Paracoccaceae bacterium]|nr:glycosyltransferase [Paracoccaceae bacterium]
MPDKQEHVRIVMAVYNGALCLLPQLESIAQQSHRNWSILISDDGSTDHSLEIIDAFKHDNPTHQITCVGGPKLGFAQNFVSLLRRAPIDESYLAFSDQDDVWLNDRLARGLEALKLVGPNRPALFCSRTWVTDANLGHRRLSTSRNRPPGFLNALVQNIAAGNTILLNPAARQLVCAASHEVGDLVA